MTVGWLSVGCRMEWITEYVLSRGYADDDDDEMGLESDWLRSGFLPTVWDSPGRFSGDT